MSIVVIGVNHRTGPLSVLERLTIAPDDVAKAVVGLAARDNLREVVVLSTCNRTEVYVVAERFHGAYADIRDFLCELGVAARRRAAPAPVQPARRGRRPAPVRGRRRARLGRARRERDPRSGAHGVAGRQGRGRRALDARPAVPSRHERRQAGAHARPSIGRGTSSVSHAAVEMVTDRSGRSTGRNVLVVGAGEMGVGVAIALHKAGAADDHRVQPHAPARQPPRRPRRRSGRRSRPARRRARRRRRRRRLHGVGPERASLVDDVAANQRADRPLLIVDIAVPRSRRRSRRRARRRHRARPRRPARLGRSRHRPAVRRGRPRPRHRQRGGRAVRARGRRPARPRRSSAELHDAAEPMRPGRSPASPTASPTSTTTSATPSRR